MYDVFIIGAGICGASAASFLSRYRLKVALADKGSDVCEGTSKANTAIVHSGHDAEPGTKKAKYNVLGNLMYEELCRELDVPFKRNSTIIAAFSDEELKVLDEIEEKAKINGVGNMQRLSRDEVIQREPNIGRGIKGALAANNGGIVGPYELVIALAENAVMNGTELLLNTEVTGLRREDGLWHIDTKDGRTFESRTVINCAGLWADELNNMVSENKYHITPRKGEYLIVDKTHENAFSASICPVPLKLATGHTKGVWVAPTVSGTILLGPTAVDVDSKDDVANTEEGFDQIISFTSNLWNGLPKGDVISCYAGLRAHCDKNDFQIGEAVDAPGFYNCGGIESPGITAGPAIGRELADEIAAKLGAEKRSDYVPGRAKHKKPFREMNADERRAAIAENAEYGRVVCRCEVVTEAEIRDAIRRPAGARTLDGVKRRTRAGMGRCQSGFCLPRVMEILCEELGIAPTEVTKSGEGSEIVVERLFSDKKEEL